MTIDEHVNEFLKNKGKLAEPLKDNEFDIIEYQKLVIEEMKKLGATEADLNLVGIGVLRTGIKHKRSPKDIAWALMQ